MFPLVFLPVSYFRFHDFLVTKQSSVMLSVLYMDKFYYKTEILFSIIVADFANYIFSLDNFLFFSELICCSFLYFQIVSLQLFLGHSKIASLKGGLLVKNEANKVYHLEVYFELYNQYL